MRRLCTRLLSGAIAAATLVFAPMAGAAGIDSTFGSGGISLNPLSATAGDRYWATAAAADGGTYNAGYTTVGGANRAFVVTKASPSGELDPSFGAGGIAVVDVVPGPFVAGPVPPAGGAAQAGPDGSAETARGIAVQPNGKLVVLGQAETLQDGSAADSRDLDVYVARLNADGSRDLTFGVNGVTRVELSDGLAQYAPDATVTAPTTDQAGYSIHVSSTNKIVFAASVGLDGSEPTRTDREIASVQLHSNGTLDASYGVGGIAVGENLETGGPINENLRMSLLDPSGKHVVASYSNIAGLNRPFIYRFNSNGSLDPAFGSNGIASELVAGPAPGMAEAYGVQMQGDKYVITGYGIRSTTPENSIDAIAYRFNANGTWDQSFAVDGLASYNRPEGGGTNYQDRSRNHVVLPDGRIVIAGQTGPEGLMLVLTPNGLPDTSISPDGGVVFDLGGNADAFWGIASAGSGVVAAGFVSTTGSANLDDSALAKLDFSVPTPPPPAPQPLARRAGKVTIGCKLVGRKKAKKVRCTVTQENVGTGNARLSLKQLGVKKPNTISGRAKVNKRGRSVITLNTGRSGRFRVEVKLPTPAGTVHTITRTVTVK